jgi:hypothetical protein
MGHRWVTDAARLFRGHWCPRCRISDRDTLQHMRQVAHERGGACLSSEYRDSSTPLRWRCREGHEWSAKPGTITQGSWCRTCERGFGRSRRRLSIEVMHEMAAERGGECLSNAYQGIYLRLRWKCARGHEWVTPANNVRRGGWCPRCAHSIRGTLEGMRAHAAEKGGRCLAESWNNHREPLPFQCAAGHRFAMHATVVKTGVWCPTCGSRSGKVQRA